MAPRRLAAGHFVSPKSKLTKAIRKRKRHGSNRKSSLHQKVSYVPARSKVFRGVINPECPICLGSGWVCENHPKLAWSERLGCQCGAGMPCECVSVARLKSRMSAKFSIYRRPAISVLARVPQLELGQRPGQSSPTCELQRAKDRGRGLESKVPGQ
jgi:hypothetical protein